jgi:putative peptide maturation system protein
MNESSRSICIELLEALIALADQGVEPQEARARIQELGARHPQARIDLVWDRESYEDRAHYDALLEHEGRGTISLAFCPDRGLPWPLRGVQRWSEYELLRVNQSLLRVDEAIDLIDFVWNEEPLLRRLIDTCLMRETLEKEPIEVSDQELQAAMDEFRAARGLHSREQMLAWMKDRGLDLSRLEQHLEWETMKAHLRRKVVAHRVEGYFATARSTLDVVDFAELVFEDPAEASQVADRLRRGTADFFAIAAEAFVQRGGRARLFTRASRDELAPAAAQALFGAGTGAIVGPVLVDRTSRIYRVLALRPAELDRATRDRIEQKLFDEWMAERRSSARIEWNWGMDPDRGSDDRIRPYR